MPSASAASVPGQQREVHVALFRGLAAVRVDRHQLRAAALGLLHPAPQVQVGDDRIRAPDQDQPRVFELLEVGADSRADRRDIPALPADEQIVRSSSDAPSLLKKRRSIEPYCSRPMVPA